MMPAKRAITACALLFIAAFVPAARAFDTVDTSSSPYAAPGKRLRKPVHADAYQKALAARFHRNENELAALAARGYGKNELIKLLLISQKSGRNLIDIVRMRDRNNRLAAMARQFKIDYPSLLAEAAAIRKETDYSLPASSAAVDIHATPTGIVITPRRPEGVHPSSSTVQPQ